MIDHVYISVTNIAKSLAFYLEALKPLGWSAFGNYDSASGPERVPDLHGIGDDVLLHKAQKLDPSVDRSTVYRTLGLLKWQGLIDEPLLRT